MQEPDWDGIMREAWESAIAKEFQRAGTLGIECLLEILDDMAGRAETEEQRAALGCLYKFLGSEPAQLDNRDDGLALVALNAGTVSMMKAMFDKEENPVTEAEAAFLFSVFAIVYQMGYQRAVSG